MVEMTAGEEVPKLISAADDASTMSELSRLKLAGNASGIPEVVKAEEAAVGTIVEEMTSMLLLLSRETEGATERATGLLVEDMVLLEDSSGPRPPDRETAEATVGTGDVSSNGLVERLDIDSGHGEGIMESERGLEAADDRTPGIGNVPVRVEVQSDGSARPGVEPPRTDTTAGVEALPGVSESIEIAKGVEPALEVPVSTENGFTWSGIISWRGLIATHRKISWHHRGLGRGLGTFTSCEDCLGDIDGLGISKPGEKQACDDD